MNHLVNKRQRTFNSNKRQRTFNSKPEVVPGRMNVDSTKSSKEETFTSVSRHVAYYTWTRLDKLIFPVI